MLQPDYNIGNYECEVDDDALIALVRNVVTGKVARRFTGETAWADARRYASDLHWAERR